MMFMFWPFVLLVIVLVVLLAVTGRETRVPMMGCMGHGEMSDRPGAKTALDIARERYARGEIDKEEFEEIMRNLAT
jgi:uncharacterized membrane protein